MRRKSQPAESHAQPTQQGTPKKATGQMSKGATPEQWDELFRFSGFRVMTLKQEQARPMRPETRNRLLHAWQDLFAFLGFPALPTAREKLLEMLKTEGHTNEELASSSLLTGLLAALTLLIEKSLDMSEEPTPEELEKNLAAITGLRYKFRGIFKKSAAKIAKTMPHHPGGAPRVFTKEESAQVCREIMELHERGFLKSEAFKRLARKYKTSVRTIERAWLGRPRQK